MHLPWQRTGDVLNVGRIELHLVLDHNGDMLRCTQYMRLYDKAPGGKVAVQSSFSTARDPFPLQL